MSTADKTFSKNDLEALDFHSKGKPGKIEIRSTKATNTEKALSLAYSPGVAAPCKVIAKEPLKVYDYTARGNLVAVITNGTAVLGLGNIGPLAAKPVMEGKGILFKQFAGIDVFDIELNTLDVESTVAAVKALEPTFGAINLEDIKAPECFEIENRLKAEMKIPVFHDDQHGTAIVSGAALLNACHLTNRKMENIKIVVNGAGAAAIACSHIFISLGVKRQNLIMCDSQGVIFKGRRDGMNKYKELFSVETGCRNLGQALDGADAFVGLSAAGAVTPEMILKMAKDPIIFAMANPDPEITPEAAKKARPDAIIATGRSDYPNQVNNVLGFPSIFRAALDIRATQINEEMKLAACHALAELAREDVPDGVSSSYEGQVFKYGRDYLIPKPFDSRVLLRTAVAVAKAAIKSGVAQKLIENFDEYRDRLEAIQGPSKVFIRSVIHKIHIGVQLSNGYLPKIVFPEGASGKVLKAISSLVDEKICQPILLGNKSVIFDKIKELDLPQLMSIPIIDPLQSIDHEQYSSELHKRRARKGVDMPEARRLMTDPNYFASMMLEHGHADGLVSGATQNYADAVKPILRVIGTSKNGIAAGLNFVLLKNRIILLADTTINKDPTALELSKIAIQTAQVLEYFGQVPQIAMLSYSNFTGDSGTPEKMKWAAELVKLDKPHYMVDGDIQADAAVNSDILKIIFPFSNLKTGANILIFPNLEASNISYKLLQQLGEVEVIGPFLTGVRGSVNVLQRTSTVEGIVNSVVLTCLEAQYFKDKKNKSNSNAEVKTNIL